MSTITIAPEDQANQTLLANVHPTPWRNPVPDGKYNLVVVGGGTAGLITAAVTASLGAKTALIERQFLGGDCLNVGCVPSKGLIRGARAAAELITIGEYGFAPVASTSALSIDFAAVMQRMRTIRSEISAHDSAARYRDEFGVDMYIGDGTFTAPTTIAVAADSGERREIAFSRAVIAAGARAAAPPIPGLDQVAYLNNENLFTLTELPDRLAVIGAGPIGCEMAQSFARLGSNVDLFEMAPRVLPREDPDVSEIIQHELERAGVTLHLGVRVEAVSPETDPDRARIRYRPADAEEQVSEPARVLVAIGRAPNLDGLGLEVAGVRTHKRGIEVNDYLQTSNKRIYAAGDIAIPYQFTHMAEVSATIAVQNALFFRTKKLSTDSIPWCTYTSPEVAHVGLSEESAKAQGIAYDKFMHRMDAVDRARLDGETEGFVKILTTKGKTKILGATIVAAHAGEMLGEIVLAMQNDLGIGALASVVHPYPTQAEAIKRAAAGYLKQKLTARVRSMMEWWFRRRR